MTFLNKKTILLLCIMFIGLNMQAQQRNCASMDVLEKNLQMNQQFQSQMETIEEHTQRIIKKSGFESKANGIITIPVVVHVIYRTSQQNISEAQIMSQLQVLNDDFRRLNSDANNTWSQAADTEIEFCLASVDPNGNATSGITRKYVNKTEWGTNDAMKYASQGGVDAWSTGDYLNMWVCNIGGGILGYAQFPGSGSAATDGVVMSPQYFGTTGYVSSPFDGGRTTTHEVGHWLNLRHIWGDGNCNADDFVSDTPTSDAANYGCATGHVSCNSTDMVQNYMDYSDDACMNLFTAGQKARMRALFDAGGFRASLLNSNGCGSSGGGGGGGGTACTDTEVSISITFDNYPEETSWSITNSNGTTVASGGTYGSQADGSTLTLTECLPDGCYDFTITDAYGDGICCSYGNGSYSVTGGGSTLASGGSFGASESTNFCLGGSGGGGGSTATCNDGVQNQGETGIDCGGPCSACATCNDGVQNQGETGVDCGGPCSACATCNDGIQNQGETGVDCGGPCSPCNTGGGGGNGCVTFDAEDFESGWGIWNDGGSDCYRNNYAAYASSGNYTIRIRDNSGAASAMTSDNLNLNGYTEVTIDFHYRPVGMDTNEDFWLLGSVDGGSNWITLNTWTRDTDFNNNTNYNESIVITGGFTSTTKFRIQCDASVNNDRIYIDDVVLTACAGARLMEEGTDMPLTVSAHNSTEVIGSTDVADNIADNVRNEGEILSNEIKVFPNPARDIANIAIQFEEEGDGEVRIMDMSGRVVEVRAIRLDGKQQSIQFDTSNFTAGVYFVNLLTEGQKVTKKLIVVK